MQVKDFTSTELEIIKQLFISLSRQDKQSFMKSLNNKENVSNKLVSQKEIKSCPHCNSESFIKNGKKDGIQRFMCKDCRKTFTFTNNTILFGTKKDLATWQTFIYCMIEKYSLRKTAKICNINPSTAFIWRHKILDALQNMMNEVKLDGIVKADETFLSLSCKGNYKNFQLPRLSKEQERHRKKWLI